MHIEWRWGWGEGVGLGDVATQLAVRELSRKKKKKKSWGVCRCSLNRAAAHCGHTHAHTRGWVAAAAGDPEKLLTCML